MTPPFLHIYLTKNFCGSSTPQFHHIYSTETFLRITDTSILRINSTDVFLRILDTSISMHLLQPKYTFASSTPPFLRFYETKLFLRIPYTSISTYQLHQNILLASLTPPLLYIYLTKIFFCILNTSICAYLPASNLDNVQGQESSNNCCTDPLGDTLLKHGDSTFHQCQDSDILHAQHWTPVVFEHAGYRPLPTVLWNHVLWPSISFDPTSGCSV